MSAQKRVAPKVVKTSPVTLVSSVPDSSSTRRLRQLKHRGWKPGKRTAWPRQPVPGAWKLTKQAADTLWTHRRLFIGITLVYGLLNLVLVQGLSSSSNTDVGSLKHTLNQVFTGDFRSITSSLTIFVVLVGSAGNGSSQTAGAYQVFLFLMVSLAVIWALRQVQAGTSVRVRDAYYRGMYPLVPFVLVLSVIGLQLLPLLIGAELYSLITTNGIAVNAAEKIISGVIFFITACISLYLICSSLFALYIVTLPDMTPLKALRSARQLVRYRRWNVLRKLLWLPLLLLIVAAIVMLPVIIWLTPAAQWIFFVLTMLAVAAAHSYIYNLYRELINE